MFLGDEPFTLGKTRKVASGEILSGNVIAYPQRFGNFFKKGFLSEIIIIYLMIY